MFRLGRFWFEFASICSIEFTVRLRSFAPPSNDTLGDADDRLGGRFAGREFAGRRDSWVGEIRHDAE
jgi:hypothetical protein